MALLERLLVCEPTLALELPRLQLGPASVDALTLLARVLDAAAALEHPDLHVLGALTGQHRADPHSKSARLRDVAGAFTDDYPFVRHLCIVLV